MDWLAGYGDVQGVLGLAGLAAVHLVRYSAEHMLPDPDTVRERVICVMFVNMSCDECGKTFLKPDYLIKKNNFCCRLCLNKWNSKRIRNLNYSVINVKGHNLGHSAVHLSKWNRIRNSLFPVQIDPAKRGPRNGKIARQIASQVIGRDLLPDEHVHHIDGNPSNNDPSNLAVMGRSEHLKLHAALARERMKAGVDVGV